MVSSNLRSTYKDIEINQQILFLEELLKERFDIIVRVGYFKKKHGLQSLDPKRWQEVLDRLKTQGQSFYIPENVIDIFWNDIHSIALQIEERISKESTFQDTNENLHTLRLKINNIDSTILETISNINERNRGERLQQIIGDVLNNVSKTLGF